MPPKKDKKGGGGGATGNNVYILHKEFAWMPAQLIEITGDKAKVKIPTYEDEAAIACDCGENAKSWRDETISLKHYPGKTLPLQNIKAGKLQVCEDMVDLAFLHEAAILYNMKARHTQALPYTRTGDIVIAVNPYQWLTYLYTEEMQVNYSNKLVWEEHDGDARKLVEPHVYETSALCYKGLAADGMNQSILVSGESGAGKTETVKICMNHIAAVQRGKVTKDDKCEMNPVVRRVVDSNPLLEAFGNAKTRRNDNSSRFGKYIQLQFDREDQPAMGERVPACRLAGSTCEVYLLEKSRVVEHDGKERTYHMLYQLLDAEDKDKAEVWQGLKGRHFKDFRYVGHTDHVLVEGKRDGAHYYDTVKALDLVGVKGDSLMTLMRAIAAVIQCGNISFGPLQGDNEKSTVTTQDEFKALADLLEVGESDMEKALTERSMVTRGETFKVPLKPDQAQDSCDAFAKEIYNKLFLWLVREINAATCAEDNYDGGKKSGFGTVGLLDIFGFESFPVNGYEQLAINYANEKLQQKFTRDIFQAVQEEYRFEGIALNDITYDDNSDVLDLIESRTGLCAMLNEECVRPKGSDKEFVYKAINQNKTSPCLICDRLLGPLDFGIHHYAGKVVYCAKGFLARNMDSISADLIALAKKATNDIIANHLQNEKMSKTESPAAAAPNRSAPRRGKSNIAADTLWTKFKTQVNSLMAKLNETQSRYIRCVKPNTLKAKLVMQHMTTIEQLRCAGVVAAVTISRSAFPNRLDHRACLDRFKVLKSFAGDKSEPKDQVVKLIDPILGKIDKEDGKAPYVVGKTRVYFRMGMLEILEQERVKGFDKWAYDIQRVTRGWMIRRTKQARSMGSKAKMVVPIQNAWRCHLARRELRKLKKAKKANRKKEKKKNKAAAKLQACVRTFLWRPKFLEMVKEKREKEGLRNKIHDLEDKVREAEKLRHAEVEAAREAAEAEMEAYRAKMKEELANNKEKQKKSAQQQTLIDESGKIIEYLRKENMKLRNQNDTMRKDFRSLKENNQRLMEANASAGASFSALNDHAKQLNVTNAKLIKNVEAYKAQLEKLKDDLKTRQAYYLAEAEARLAYQKTMAQIVGAIQDQCRDPQLVEDVVIMALECEAEAKSERAALEAAGGKGKGKGGGGGGGGGRGGRGGGSGSSATPSLAKTETSQPDDSDSDDSDSDSD